VEQGNVKRVRSRLGAGSSNWVTVWNQYDAYGNITQVTDARGEVSVVVFDDNLFALHPVTERNALLHEVHRVTDLRYGTPIQATGVNGEVAQSGYDGLGRILCEARPGESIPRPAQDPAGCNQTASFTYSTQYEYQWGDPGAADFEGKLSFVEVRAREPNESARGYLVGRQYTDALGRALLSTREQVIGIDTGLSTVVVDHVTYGPGGRIDATYVPYELTGPLVETPSAATTTLDYRLNGSAAIDPLGRAHVVTPPDGNPTTTFYEGSRTRIVDPLGNEVRSIEDDFGREVRRELYDGGALAMFYDYAYDGLGRLLTTTVSGDTATTVAQSYDTLGRQIRLDDPDSGTWHYGYDENGHLVYRDDPKTGQHVQWEYDALGRVVRRCLFENGDAYVATSGDCGSGTEESTYTYDDTNAGNQGIGRLTGASDLSGSELVVYDAPWRASPRSCSSSTTRPIT
jgi:YD repeat-containing protein